MTLAVYITNHKQILTGCEVKNEYRFHRCCIYLKGISMTVALSLIGAVLRNSLKCSAFSLLTESGLSIAAKTPLAAVNVDKEVSI